MQVILFIGLIYFVNCTAVDCSDKSQYCPTCINKTTNSFINIWENQKNSLN